MFGHNLLTNESFPASDINGGIHNCTGGVVWIYDLLGLCVLGTRMYVAVICSFISIAAWIMNLIPQIIENCRSGKPDKAVSPWLLIFWTTGDTCNLIGTILMKQLTMQKAIAAYCIVSDIILITQFIYFYVKHKRKSRYLYVNFNEDDSDSISVRAPLTNSQQSNLSEAPTRLFMWSGIGMLGFFIYFCAVSLGVDTTAVFLNPSHVLPDRSITFKSRQLLTVKPHIPPLLKDWTEIGGYALGCVSSTFYLSARIPQLMQNRRRQSTEGLSIFVFLLTITGNITYSLQIFLISIDKRWILRSLPWIIGSSGVLLLDFVMLFQFFFYRNNHSTDDASENTDPETDSLDDTRPLTFS